MKKQHTIYVLKELCGIVGITVVASFLGSLTYIALLGGV